MGWCRVGEEMDEVHWLGLGMVRSDRQVAQRATIAHLSPMCQVNLPQNLMQPFPHPNDATHKI